MRSLKGEICRCVVEGFAVELNDVKTTALVLGVAVAAILRCRGGIAAMEPFSLHAILVHFLMAVEAQSRLRLPRERFMALHAVFFELCVPLDQRTRDDEFLEQVLRTRLDRCECENASNEGEQDCSAAEHGHLLRSIEVDSEDMNKCRCNQQEEQRQMQDVPEGKQPFEQAEFCGLIDGREIHPQ